MEVQNFGLNLARYTKKLLSIILIFKMIHNMAKMSIFEQSVGLYTNKKIKKYLTFKKYLPYIILNRVSYI